MKITAERVTGIAYVVAPDETRALEDFSDGNANVFDTEAEAMRDEDSRNYSRFYDSESEMNTYKIVVSAERVH